ncbi:MAG: hypothetical protein N5P05_004077 (plasmid) [Chroococcopsis gigantea SAG 12.99]|jgi:predicted nuclease with TOPRIM domain|nr:hypothetical protein [Chroococcopsis gigantea SAG 12.99]
MSQTPLTISVDIADILKEISGKLDNLQKDTSEIKTELKVMDERLSGQIKSLDERLSGQIKAVDERLSGQITTLNEKVDGLAKRTDNQEFTNRGILIALVVAIIVGALKLFGVLPNS